MHFFKKIYNIKLLSLIVNIMRKLISLVFALALVIPNITSAAPFDIFNKYYPDFLISNIWQDNSSKDIYVKVCNA
ncbi:TPA: hypothetical protein DEG21_02350 [Patescibacteria group bacterium]|nr:hypothetical protein [Candidatus Gracilibacteria bacterium]